MEYDDKMQKEISAIVTWIKDYAQKACKESLVIGISGGVDSAVVSTLCAMTGLDVIVVRMPIHQMSSQNNLSIAHSRWLLQNFSDNVVCLEKDLTDTFDKFCESLEYNEMSSLSLANSRARIRMIMLYQISSTHNGLVVGTGNKVEDFGVGFFTKYGDGGVDISPIADLYKSEVRLAARTLSILEDIIKAPPTDGLWDDGRTDEDQLGMSYDDLEWVMKNIDSNKHFDKKEIDIIEKYKKVRSANLHKMAPIPVFTLKDAE